MLVAWALRRQVGGMGLSPGDGASVAFVAGLQIVHVRKDPDAYFVSLTMISVQIFVYAFYWIRSMYYPLR